MNTQALNEREWCIVERRKVERRHLIYYLRVFDRSTNEIIGHLVDITTEGLMLISEEPIEVGKEYYFRMVLPTEIDSSTQISFNGYSIWCKKDVNPDFYASGFEFELISSRDIDIIKQLVDQFGFSA